MRRQEIEQPKVGTSPFWWRVKAFTGNKEDAIGRTQCYQQGEHVSCATGTSTPQNPVAGNAAGSPKESDNTDPILDQEYIDIAVVKLAEEGLLPMQIARVVGGRISQANRRHLNWAGPSVTAYLRLKLGPKTETIEQAQRQWEKLPVYHKEDPLPEPLPGADVSHSEDWPLMRVRVKDYRDHPPTSDEGWDDPRSKRAVTKYMKKIAQNDFDPPEAEEGGRMGDGWHRFTAAYLMGLEYIPAFVEPKRKKKATKQV